MMQLSTSYLARLLAVAATAVGVSALHDNSCVMCQNCGIALGDFSMCGPCADCCGDFIDCQLGDNGHSEYSVLDRRVVHQWGGGEGGGHGAGRDYWDSCYDFGQCKWRGVRRA